MVFRKQLGTASPKEIALVIKYLLETIYLEEWICSVGNSNETVDRSVIKNSDHYFHFNHRGYTVLFSRRMP